MDPINIPPRNVSIYIPTMDEMGDNLKVGWFRAPPRTLAMVAAKSLTPWVQLSHRFWSLFPRFGPSANVDIGIHWPQKSQKNNFKLYQSAFSSFFQLILHDLPDIYLIFTWYFYFQDSSQWPKKKPQLHLAGSFCEGPLQAARKALRRVSASFANRPDRAQGSLRSVRSLESIRIWQYISG